MVISLPAFVVVHFTFVSVLFFPTVMIVTFLVLNLGAESEVGVAEIEDWRVEVVTVVAEGMTEDNVGVSVSELEEMVVS